MCYDLGVTANLIKLFPSGSFYRSERIQNTNKIISKIIIADQKSPAGRVMIESNWESLLG